MRGIVVLAVALSMLIPYVAPALADDGTPQPESSSEGTPVENESYVVCHSRGTADGKTLGTGGSFFGGFCGGALLGLIGTGIAVLAQSEPEPPALAVVKLQSDECRLTYSEAYRSAGKRKKQNSALAGGLLGTVVAVTLILSSSN